MLRSELIKILQEQNDKHNDGEVCVSNCEGGIGYVYQTVKSVSTSGGDHKTILELLNGSRARRN